MYQARETKARLKKVKNDKKKETKAKGSRLFSLLLRPEGGWSAGWDRTRWLVARQPDFLSLSHAHAASPPFTLILSLSIPLFLSLCSFLCHSVPYRCFSRVRSARSLFLPSLHRLSLLSLSLSLVLTLKSRSSSSSSTSHTHRFL